MAGWKYFGSLAAALKYPHAARFRSLSNQALLPSSSTLLQKSSNGSVERSKPGSFVTYESRRTLRNSDFVKHFKHISTSSYSSVEYKIVSTPPFAESITEGDVRWEKGIGDQVEEDEVVGEIETDKTSIPVTASAAGVIVEVFVEDGEKVEKGDNLFKIQVGASASDSAEGEKDEKKPEISSAEESKIEPPKPTSSVSHAVTDSPLTGTDHPSDHLKEIKPTPPPAPPANQFDIKKMDSKEAPLALSGSRKEIRVKMSRMRQRIAQRLKDAQNVNAMLTTFNEIDMSNVMEMRRKHKDSFLKNHGIKLGFMSAFAKASSHALQSMPVVNAVIEDGFVIYRDFVDISVAVATPKGLVVPVLRDVQTMNFLDIEKGINALGQKARDGELAIEDMDGGTFTISNGGVFGSLLGTPIINPPQSAILGLHAINERPVAIDGQVAIRPMMYVALTYDHRLIDGREAVTFLRKVKEAVEDPRIILLNL